MTSPDYVYIVGMKSPDYIYIVGMTSPDYVYIHYTSFADDFIIRPWETDEQMTAEDEDTWKTIFQRLKSVSLFIS